MAAKADWAREVARVAMAVAVVKKVVLVEVQAVSGAVEKEAGAVVKKVVEVAQAVVMQSGRGCRCSEERSSVLRCGWRALRGAAGGARCDRTRAHAE